MKAPTGPIPSIPDFEEGFDADGIETIHYPNSDSDEVRLRHFGELSIEKWEATWIERAERREK